MNKYKYGVDPRNGLDKSKGKQEWAAKACVDKGMKSEGEKESATENKEVDVAAAVIKENEGKQRHDEDVVELELERSSKQKY